MMAVMGMAAGCLAVWLTVVVTSPEYTGAVFFGILGPFSAVAVTWLLVERVARLNPAALTSVMMIGFIVKMVLFGVYVAAVIRLANVDWTAFTVSFAASFISLYAVEALLLRRLVARLT
jgi:hypothetical protein